MNNTSTNILIVAVIILNILGFYWIMGEIQSFRDQMSNLQMNTNIAMDKASQSVSPGQKATTTEEGENSNQLKEEGAVRVPTAIIFEAQSSPLLKPQSMLTITLEEVAKTEDGTVAANIKVYTSEAESYTALNPGNLFELVNLQGNNQKPLQTKGSFDSMPPNSAVTGSVQFKVEPDREEIILKVDSNEETNHYRFNFEEETYEEAILG